MAVTTISRARKQLAQLLQRVACGETITITRHGVPVAKLVPVERGEEMAPAEAASQLHEFAQGGGLDGLSIRELIDEGRPTDVRN